MKKFIKSLSKALCLLLVVSFAAVSFIGCKNKNNNTNTADNTASSTIGGETGGVADNVNEGEEPVETPEETISLNGIYKMARPVTYKDTMWEVSNEEVFAFFETTDINGVYNALRKLGMLEFANTNTTIIDGILYEYLVGFIGDNYYGLLYDGYSYTISMTAEVSMITSKIEIIDENNYIVYSPFIYAGENGEPVVTPVFIKIPYVKIANSEDILIGATYTYETGSAKISLSNQSTMTEEEALIAAANILGVSTENPSESIEELFASYNVQIDDMLTKATLFDTEDDSFTFAPITNTICVIDGVSIKITHRYINVATKIETINLEIVIDSNTTLIFSYQAI